MGTNFYIKNKLSEDLKLQAIQSLLNDEYGTVRDILCNAEDIHIGKRSAGWQFLFNANNFKYFNPTKESLIQWLKSGQIIDEYGEKFTFEQFWNEEISLDKELLNLEKYFIKYPYEPNYATESERKFFKKQYNISVDNYGEFYIEGLRFTTSSEFC